MRRRRVPAEGLRKAVLALQLQALRGRSRSASYDPSWLQARVRNWPDRARAERRRAALVRDLELYFRQLGQVAAHGRRVGAAALHSKLNTWAWAMKPPPQRAYGPLRTAHQLSLPFTETTNREAPPCRQ